MSGTRFVEAVISMPAGAVRIVSLYLPNGNPPNTEKYDYKLRWTSKIRKHVNVTTYKSVFGRMLMVGATRIAPVLFHSNLGVVG